MNGTENQPPQNQASGAVKKSISLEGTLWVAAEKRAAQEVRSTSNYIAWLIAKDVSEHEPKAEAK